MHARTEDVAEPLDAGTGPDGAGDPTVEVRRRGGLLAAVGVAAAALAVAYLRRATQTGSTLDWVLTGLLALIATFFLVGLVDSRAPLLVADSRGARVRYGRSWRGVAWEDLAHLEHTPGRTPWRDGRLRLVPAQEEPIEVSVGLATRFPGSAAELVEALAGLSADRVPVLAGSSVLRSAPRWRDPRPAVARGIGTLAGRLRPSGPPDRADTAVEPETPAAMPAIAASATPAPLRQLRPGQRADLTLGALALAPGQDETTVVLPEVAELRRSPWDETEPWATEAPPAQDQAVPAVPDPVIGPQLAAARGRLSLDVDDLAGRTRIRPHVIESIERDDFGPCGGDFYARGHLRTLARVLGVDSAPLLAEYDERYSHGPVSPRRVFEAEHATGAGGSIRGTRGGYHWSVLVAAAMTVVLAWSLARLVIDGPVEIDQVPGLGAGSGGIGQGGAPAGAAVPVLVRAAGGGAHVVVRDGNGRIALSGDLPFGASRALEVAPPIRVETSDGSLEVVVDGEDQGPIGRTGQPASGTFVAP